MQLDELQYLPEMPQEDQAVTATNLTDIFRRAGLQVTPVLSTHFKDRLWGREHSVLATEVVTAFAKAMQKYGSQIISDLEQTGKYTATIKDYSSNLNIVFTLENPVKTGETTKYRLYGITLMRKPPKQFVVRGGDVLVVEGVDDVVDYGSYVKLPAPKKKKSKKIPTTDRAENSIINTLWHYQNADAS